MKKDEFLFNIFLGLSIFVWGVIGLYNGIFEQFSTVRLSSSTLNLVIGVLIISRKAVIKSGSIKSVLISIPSLILGGILFKIAHPFDNWSLLSEFAFVIGTLFTIISYIFLGKNFSICPKLRSVTINGPYSIIRHPGYTCEIVLILLCCIENISPLTIIVFMVFIYSLYCRIMEEEKILSTTQEYIKYKSNVKWRILPYVW